MLSVAAGGRIVAAQTFSSDFSVDVRVPADLVAGEESEITLTADQFYVPAERRWPRHRRRA